MALNKVEICGVNTATLPILTKEEKTDLDTLETIYPSSLLFF